MEIYLADDERFYHVLNVFLNFFLQRFYIYALRYFCEVQVENLDSRLTCIIICKHHSTFNKHNTGFPLHYSPYSWWRGTVVERRSLAGELSLSCA